MRTPQPRLGEKPRGDTYLTHVNGSKHAKPCKIHPHPGTEERSPDNLTWTSDGRLLVGGQIATAIQAAGCFEVLEGTCGLDSAASIVDPASLEVERIWTHAPATVAGGASVALEHDGKIWIGTFGGDRIAWFDKPAP